MANKKTTNSATVWTGAVAGFNNQPNNNLVEDKKVSLNSPVRSLVDEVKNGTYNAPAVKATSQNNTNTNTSSNVNATSSTSSSKWLSTKKTTSNTNPNAVYDENGNYLGSKDIVGGWTTTTKRTTSEYDKQMSMLDDLYKSWKISQEQYDSTAWVINNKFGNKWDSGVIKKDTNVNLGDNNVWDNNYDSNFDDSQAGYFRDAEWNEIKIYGYQALSNDMKKYVDQMSDEEKKYISNMWAQALQNYIKTWVDENVEKEYREKQRDLAQDMRDIQTQQEEVQYWQQLRQAKEQVNNLMQNWEYLWNMGMPGLSKTKLQAISDSITEAETSLNEMVKLQDLAKQASAKNWEMDLAKYTKQIDDIVRDLNYKIPQEIQNALNKYTVAELEWKLDTIDWVVAFKKSLLDDLDNNISGMTSASLGQMQYITQSYMDMADKAYEEAKEYKANQSKINTEMSSVIWYYIDGNGDPILWSNGMPIKVPQSAPMEPVFDKESGRLIQFYYNDDWSIGATYTQVYSGDQSATQSTIVSLLEQGVGVQDILKYVPNADLKTVQELAKIVNVKYRTDWLSRVYNWKDYNAVSQQKVDEVLGTLQEWGWWGQCGYFVNNYLEKLGVWRLYSDPIKDKTKNINSAEPKVWDIIVMDSPTHPEYWHVWIIKAIDDNWNMVILQSNKNDNEQIYTSTKNVNDEDIYGYFDPRKSIDEYDAESEMLTNSNWYGLQEFENWFDPVKTGYYQKFLDWKMVSTDWDRMWNNFMDELHNYQNYINSQVPQEAQKLLDIIEDLKKMSRWDYNKAAAWKLLPRTSWYAYYKKFKQFIASASLNNLIEMKKQWATFGALSDNELWFITDAATDLDFGLKYRDFMKELDYYETQLKSKLGRYDVEGSTSSGWTDRRL